MEYEYVALVTLLLLCQFIFFMGKVGQARVAADVQAPAATGDERFERANRIHINTLEQLMIALPAMWVCAYYFNPTLAAALGLAFLIGRALYGRAYAADPASRGPGMMIGFIAYVAMIGTGLWGVISGLL